MLDKQWGLGTGAHVLPIVFPNAALAAYATRWGNGNDVASVFNVTNSTITIWSNLNANSNWFVLGH